MPALRGIHRALASALLLSAATAALAQTKGGGFIVDMPVAGAPAPATPARVEQPAAQPSIPKAEEPTARLLRAQPLAGDGEGPDESALRYYAQLGQMERVNTEIERLVRLYPGWTPPMDLFNGEAPGDPSEDAYWELFATDRIDELRAAMNARKKEEPNWQPSKDLATKMRRKELRVRIMDFWKKGRWQDLVDYVKADNYNADDADVEMLWTIAEAFSKTKQTNDAVSVYLSILKSNADQPARLATIQKAMANLRMADVEKLIAAGRYDAIGRSEFAPIMVDVVRARISAYLHDERSEKIPAPELDVFQAYAREEKDPNQPGLVAWYYYKTKTFRDALDWFKIALERGGDAMIAHGLAHSLRELDMRRETEEVAYAWREPLVNNLILFIDILERDLTLEFPPFIEPERLARYAKVTMDVASGEGAQALAWYAYNSCQYEVAHQWFQRAVAWFPKEATVYGYALTLQKMKQTKEFWDLMNRYDGLFGKVLEIIFPDGRYHPPTPCDELANARLRQQQQAVGAYTVPGSNPAAPPQGVPLQNLTAAQAAGYVYNGQYGAGWGYQQQQQRVELPKIDRKFFPVAVDPENPLRYAATAAPNAQSPAQFAQAAAQIALQPEPFRGPYPLVAARVPGVGRMPYERYGFSLLPGWNGVNGPTTPTYAAQIAPAGTLWATELPEKDRPKTAIEAGGAGPSTVVNSSAVSTAPNSIGAPAVAPNSVGASPAPTSVAPNASLDAGVRVVGTAIGVPPSAPQMAASPAVAVAPPRPLPSPAVYTPPVAPGSSADAPAPLVRPGYAAQLPEAADAGTLAQRAAQYFNEKNYAAALDALERRAAMAPETTELRMMRGWSLLHLNRKDEARNAFATLGKAAPGQSLQGGK
jgi:tetratricopeptide (TPR) repeat protein